MSGIVIKRMDRMTPKHVNKHEKYEHYRYDVTDNKQKYNVDKPIDGNQTVTAFYVLPPGMSSYPFHYHTVNEEVFYIISGSGVLETFSGEQTVTAGDVIVFPAGKEGAHKLTNDSETENLVYLDVDTNKTPEIAYYPHSNKVGIRACGVRQNFDLGTTVGYYEGE